ncbi:hypothetical protein CRG98_013225 [Punica granatum]|uniref:Uncharacterized protein n=1 Tax=Punica granatum TaxID=22663 RepID=A0A2I0KE12_PUNGR|nr:hypothetical protein CRG98_013225 [Punica granatum]
MAGELKLDGAMVKFFASLVHAVFCRMSLRSTVSLALNSWWAGYLGYWQERPEISMSLKKAWKPASLISALSQTRKEKIHAGMEFSAAEKNAAIIKNAAHVQVGLRGLAEEN